MYELHQAVERIVDQVRRGRRVFIHCYAGLGRSGVVAAAYLARVYGMEGAEAVGAVREARPGAVGAREQESVVRAYAYAVKVLGPEALGLLLERAAAAGWGSCHPREASRAVHLAVRAGEALELGSGCLALLLSSVLRKVCSLEVPPGSRARCSNRKVVDAVAELVKPLAENFDKVVDLEIDAEADHVFLELFCTLPCPDTVEECSRRAAKLRGVLRKDVVVEEVPG